MIKNSNRLGKIFRKPQGGFFLTGTVGVTLHYWHTLRASLFNTSDCRNFF